LNSLLSSYLAEKSAPSVAKKYFIGTNSIHVPRENMEIVSPLKDVMSKLMTSYSTHDTCHCVTHVKNYLEMNTNYFYLVEDWDMFENLVEHVYKRHIRSDTSLHPVLMSEASVCSVYMNSLYLYSLVIKNWQGWI
jgi:hypothetical protein